MNFLIVEGFAGEAALLAGSGWLQLWGAHSQDLTAQSSACLGSLFPCRESGSSITALASPTAAIQPQLMEQPQCTLSSLHMFLPYLSPWNSLIGFYTSWEHGAGQTCSELCACPLLVWKRMPPWRLTVLALCSPLLSAHKCVQFAQAR